ncbi:MAG: response regulator, partial [Sphingomonas sp.]|nr:response regulator [Sphingomonas sp.]
MIVDDSMVARAVLSRMIESDDEFEICGVAGTAEDAIEALQAVRVDVILLDLEMPGAGGLKSIPRILAAGAGARIMIVSSLAEEGAEETVTALALGAADTLPKPGTGRFNGRFSEILIGKLRALGHGGPRLPDTSAVRDYTHASPLRSMPAHAASIIAIGASTGGIHALG